MNILQQGLKLVDDAIFHLKLEKMENHELIGRMSKQLKIEPKQAMRIAVGVLIVMTTILVSLFAKTFSFLVISVLYPAVMTGRVIINEGVSKDAKLFLSYWACFGFLFLFNIVFGFFLQFVPLYGLLQCVFMIWLYNRHTRGAEKVRDIVFQPLMDKIGHRFTNPSSEQSKEPMAKSD